ncbi:MAG: hypothetical protein IH886_11050 [Nitrospinae bacterium]|nr:hypothetical protein [Nitrospinota bacterium]
MINLDNQTIEINCPRCDFYNPLFLKQARNRDILICRGCKINIQLDDYLNECRKAEKEFRRSIKELEKSFKELNKNLKFKFNF